MAESRPSASSSFATTRWTVVCAAFSAGDREALEQLCTQYWLPLYVYVRRRGYQAEDAQDLTQAFFAWLLEKRTLRDLSREGGRFRAFLLTCLRNFLHNERDRVQARKRGGGTRIVPLDFDDAERSIDPADPRAPEASFDRQWALCLLEKARTRLRAEHVSVEQQRWCDELLPILGGDGACTYRDIAAKLGSTEGAVKVAVHRFRRRFREILREEISRTLDSDDAIDDEIRDLFGALRG